MEEFHHNRIIIFNELRPLMKEKYLKFLVDHDIKFTKEKDYYIANIRLLKETKENSNEISSIESEDNNCFTEDNNSAVLLINKYFPNMTLRRIDLLNNDKPTTLIHRLINDIYDSRFKDVMENLEEGNSIPHCRNFSNYVISFLKKRYGLKSIVQQMCYDIAFAINSTRDHNVHMNIFANFLEDKYDPHEILFFLHVRSIILNLPASDVTTKENETTWLTQDQLLLMAKHVFGSRGDQLYQQFYQKILQYLQGKSKTYTMETANFLKIVLETYHESCYDSNTRTEQCKQELKDDQLEENTIFIDDLQVKDSFFATKISLEKNEKYESSSFLVMDIPIDKQDRLFRDAEKHYEENIHLFKK